MNKCYNQNLSNYYFAKQLIKDDMREEIKVVFVVEEYSDWDKSLPVYEEFLTRKNVKTFIVLLPTYSTPDYLAKRPYGRYDRKIWEFFHKKYEDVYDITNIGNLKKLKPDYVFMQSPYEHLRPILGSNEVMKYAKVCYVPYGATGAERFLRMHCENICFFSNVSMGFLSSEDVKKEMDTAWNVSVSKGYQSFFNVGYPSLDIDFPLKEKNDQKCKKVLWTPRWTYDESIGGSHFFEYKDGYLNFARNHKNDSFGIRPHPLMFETFINEGRITREEVDKYKEDLHKADVIIDDDNRFITDTLSETDILVTDFSSIMATYFVSGRPMIYCTSQHKLIGDFKKFMKGTYIAENWEDVERHLDNLLRGIDPLQAIREQVSREFKNFHTGAAKRIVNTIVQNYRERSFNEKEGMKNFVQEEDNILQQKVAVANQILKLESVQNITACNWYSYYLELIEIKMTDKRLMEMENNCYRQIVDIYTKQENNEKKYLAEIAMLLFVEPERMEVPIEICKWNSELKSDLACKLEYQGLGI